MVSTYQDPIAGWTNNITGINGLCVGIGVGFLRHLHVSNDFVIDIICADFVINTTLAAIWTASDKMKETKQIPPPEVYHVTSKGFFLTSGNCNLVTTTCLFRWNIHQLIYAKEFYSAQWLEKCFHLKYFREYFFILFISNTNRSEE